MGSFYSPATCLEPKPLRLPPELATFASQFCLPRELLCWELYGIVVATCDADRSGLDLEFQAAPGSGVAVVSSPGPVGSCE